jgi:hypothetical protein
MSAARASEAKTNPKQLGLELERMALRAARRVYDDTNAALFGGKLRPPALELSDSASRLGCYVHSSRTLQLARPLLVDHGWNVLVEVLRHEMAHQFVHEVLGVHDETAHGPAFRRVCQERGIDARAAGMPDAADPAETHVLERIAKLLALAESANQHEASAAMSAAQRLMLKHNLDAVLLGKSRVYGHKHLGRPSGRVPESERLLAGILADHFFVEVIWVPVWRVLEGKRGSVLEVCGSRENLELAEYVHAFVSETGERLFREYRRQSGKRLARDRHRFLAGLVAGFRERLEREGKKNREQGLVWSGDGALHDFFRRRHPHVRWTRHVSHTGSEAYASGREAGRNLVLHRGVKASSEARGRLLPGRS